MRRAPLRLRVTLAFTAAIALVLAIFGLFVYLRTQSQLDEAVDDNLEVRAADLATLVPGPGQGGPTIGVQELDPEDSFAQILDPGGMAVFSTSQLDQAPLLSAGELEAAGESPITVERKSIEGIDGRARIYATPISEADRSLVAVAGATLEDRDESLRNLLLLLVIGGPVALALATAAGYVVAGRALRPVEELRREAAAITAASAGERLDLPEADDELRRLATTLNEMLGRLEAGIERERRFVDDASHELRTPLALHKTELEVALRYAEDEIALREAIASGVEEVDRLAQLADDLLVVARSDAEGLALRTDELDAAEILEGVATRFGARARSSHRSLVVEAEPALVIEADRLRIEQAMTNLVENAFRHGAGRITLGARQTAAGVRLHVRDEGSGFDESFRERAFERFSRGDAARGRGGAGLGLAIVEAIAAAHGGRAGISSPDGTCAEVWIELPQPA